RSGDLDRIGGVAYYRRRNPGISHQQVGAPANDNGRSIAQRLRQRSLCAALQVTARRTADGKAGVAGQRLVFPEKNHSFSGYKHGRLRFRYLQLVVYGEHVGNRVRSNSRALFVTLTVHHADEGDVAALHQNVNRWLRLEAVLFKPGLAVNGAENGAANVPVHGAN